MASPWYLLRFDKKDTSMRCMCTTLLTLVLLALTACGAAPQSAAPTEKPTSAGDLTTAMPAATAASTATAVLAAAPSATQTSAPTIAATVTPEKHSVPRSTTVIVQMPDRTSGPTPILARIPTSEAAPAVVGEVPTDLMSKILADAAHLSGVDTASIIVQKGEAVEWPDGSLGCPKPGVAYLQVITPGYHVLLLAGASSYDYRADGRGRFFVCTK